MAKADMFLRLEGKSTGVVKGESNVPEHFEEIEISDWTWGMTGSQALGGSGTNVKTALSEIKISKATDRSTTQLMSVMRSNEVVKKAVITVRKAGVTPALDYLTITVEGGRITSYTLGCAAPGSPELVEGFSIAFEQIEVRYVPQASQGGGTAALTFQASTK